MKFAAKTSIGKVRATNEDSYKILCGQDEKYAAFLVADGMGGHKAGEVASNLAVNVVGTVLEKAIECSIAEEEVAGLISNSIKTANREIVKAAIENQEYNGMGTTLTMAVLLGKSVYIGHVGDSRVYLIRNNQIEQITSDHSYIEELVQKGSITRQEAEHHPQKNIVTRALGVPGEVEADLYTIQALQGDKFIFCTDGLSNMITDVGILDAAKGASPEDMCDKLVSAANEAGGTDNITVISIIMDTL